jgi:hypothetical protein
MSDTANNGNTSNGTTPHRPQPAPAEPQTKRNDEVKSAPQSSAKHRSRAHANAELAHTVPVEPNGSKPKEAGDTNQDFLKLLGEHENSRTLRAGIDYFDGRLWYGMEIKGKLYFLTSGNCVVEASKLPKNVTAGTGISGPAPLSTEGIRRYLAQDHVEGAKLLAELEQLFRSHAKFQYDTTPTVLAHWSLGTYLYMAFPTYPIRCRADRSRSACSPKRSGTTSSRFPAS